MPSWSAAARNGAKTLLVERNGALGGFWISGLLTWIADIDSKGGLVEEIVENMKNFAEGRMEYRDRWYFAADTERTKLLFEKMCADAGADIRFYTQVTGVIKDGRNVKGIATESKSGAEYHRAPPRSPLPQSRERIRGRTREAHGSDLSDEPLFT